MTSGFVVQRTTNVASQQLYDRLADASDWSQWASMVDVSELVRSGSIDPLGAGAIRRVGGFGGRLTVDEEISVATSPSYQRYTARGLPARDYVGEVRIDECDGNTIIDWTGRFSPKIPGTGWILSRLLSYAIGRMADDLISACERSNAAP
jgi:hypothetical protein